MLLSKVQKQQQRKLLNDDEINVLTIYRFKFSRCCVRFDVEVLHPSSSAFIHSNKFYGLSLQFKTYSKQIQIHYEVLKSHSGNCTRIRIINMNLFL